MKTRSSVGDQRELLLRIVDEAYRLPTWNGTNLRASLRRVPAEAAAWRPPRGKRSIAEIVVHCAYWKYAIRRRLSAAPRGSFPRKGSNWFPLGLSLDSTEWQGLLGLLDEQHRLLCEAIADHPHRLSMEDSTTRESVRRIFGLAIHDAYHTGQVHLIKKLWSRNTRPSVAKSVTRKSR